MNTLENNNCWLFRAVASPLEPSFVRVVKTLLAKKYASVLHPHLPKQFYDVLLYGIDYCVTHKLPGLVTAIFFVMFYYCHSLRSVCERQLTETNSKNMFTAVAPFIYEHLMFLTHQPFCKKTMLDIWEDFLYGITTPLMARDRDVLFNKQQELKAIRQRTPTKLTATQKLQRHARAKKQELLMEQLEKRFEAGELSVDDIQRANACDVPLGIDKEVDEQLYLKQQLQLQDAAAAATTHHKAIVVENGVSKIKMVENTNASSSSSSSFVRLIRDDDSTRGGDDEDDDEYDYSSEIEDELITGISACQYNSATNKFTSVDDILDKFPLLAGFVSEH